MMEHIRQFDWCPSEPDTHFILEDELDNCVTEKILRNKFFDPLVSSDSDDEVRPKINWDEVLKKKNNFEHNHRVYVPGLRPLPPYPKLSVLTKQQHYQLLKVISAENPKVLVAEFIPRPTKTDHRLFEELKEKYIQEQKEYIDWAKTLWSHEQCIRMLRPKPPIEMVYEAEFKVRANGLRSFPRNYEMAAQIPLENKKDSFELVHQKDLITVDVTELPQIESFDIIQKKKSIMRPCSVPEPCTKHPCKFVLPNEKAVTTLPLTELHRELAQYALECGARLLAAERALRCLAELHRAWALPLSVCEAVGADGERSNVVVLGSEFSIHRDSAPVRTYKAFRHLLEYAMISPTEKAKILSRNETLPEHNDNHLNNSNDINNKDMDSDDDEDNHLFIDTGDVESNGNESDRETESIKLQDDNSQKEMADNDEPITSKSMEVGDNEKDIGVYRCTCKDSLFERPPPRSFKKWQVRNKNTNENYDLIVHCSHKVRGTVGEIILEPIPEYQIDMGASQQSPEKIKSLALALCLRRNASLLNVRIDSPTGDVVTFDNIYMEEFTKTHGDVISLVANTLHTTFNQLQGLLPGHYILQHAPSHGGNALLYATRATGAGQKLVLDFDISRLEETDEAKNVKTPPILEPALLPYHKLRKILPCAFTPNDYQLAKEPKKPVTRQKTPPQALKWPRRKFRKGNNSKN